MKLSDQHRPKSLTEVVGQPSVKVLKELTKSPAPLCKVLRGKPGCGKTSAALAFAYDMGCVDDMHGLHVLPAGSLGKAEIYELFGRKCRMRPMEGNGWHVVIIEELEQCRSKEATEALRICTEYHEQSGHGLPKRCVVIATSNDTSGLDEALKERFRPLLFQSGQSFAAACGERLQAIWRGLAGALALPPGWKNWGWSGSGQDKRFSMRRAIDDMEEYFLMNGGA